MIGHVLTGLFLGFPQLGLDGGDLDPPADLITAIANQGLQEQRHIAIVCRGPR